MHIWSYILYKEIQKTEMYLFILDIQHVANIIYAETFIQEKSHPHAKIDPL